MIKLTSKKEEWRIYELFKIVKFKKRTLLCYNRTLKNLKEEVIECLKHIIASFIYFFTIFLDFAF